MKIQGTPEILRKNTSVSTSGERHKMLFHWCYGERCPQCLQPDGGRAGVCTPDPLVIFPCGHEMTKGALDGFPAALRDSTDCLGP